MYQTTKDGAELLLVLSPFDLDPDGVPVTDESTQEDVCVMDAAERPRRIAHDFAEHLARVHANPWSDRDGVTVRLTDTEYDDVATYPAVDLAKLRPTSHDARTAFASLSIPKKALEIRHVEKLRAMMERKFRRLRASDPDPVRSTWTIDDLKVEMADARHIAVASLRMASSEFDDRECVTFNRDGFVGLCGWASSANTEPIARTFIAWCAHLARTMEMDPR